MTPAVTIMVPTRNRPGLLQDTLESLLAQDLGAEDREIVVVDDGSNPPSSVPVGVTLIRHETPLGPNAARNTAVHAATGEFLVFVDDDVDAPPGWLREMLDGAARHPDALCFAAPIRLRTEGTPPRTCGYCSIADAQLDLLTEEGPTSGYAVSANMGLRRDSLAVAGPFDQTLPIYFEEFEWQDRLRSAGGLVVYLPRAWLWHRRTQDLTRLGARLAKGYKQGRGEAYYYLEQGRPIPMKVRGVPGLVLHGIRYSCDAGFCNAAREIGKLAGVGRFVRRRARSSNRPSETSR